MSQKKGPAIGNSYAVFDTMLEGVQVHDSDWRYLYANDTLIRNSGFNKEQLLGHTVMELYPGIEGTEVFAAMSRCMETKVSERLETEFVFPDGHSNHFELSIQPLAGGILIFSVDRTEQVKASEKLIKSNRLYAFNSAINQCIVHTASQKALFDNTCSIAVNIGGFRMAVITLVDDDGYLDIASAGGHDDLTALARKKTGIHISDPMLANTPTGNALSSGNYAVSNNIVSDPAILKWKEGLIKQGIRSTMSLPLNKYGKTCGVIAFHSDTENFFDADEIILLKEAAGDISFALETFETSENYNQAKRLLEVNEQRFRALTEKSADMTTLASLEGKLIYCSPTVTSILGYLPDELTDSSVFDLIHPDDLTSFLESRSVILKTPGAYFQFRQRRLHKNKRWVWCEGTLTNMLHEDGVKALVTNLQNVTDKVEAEHQKKFDEQNQYALINNTSDLMWSVDLEFRLITSNKAFDELVKKNRGNIIEKGSKILDGASGNQLELFRGLYSRALQGEAFTETVRADGPAPSWLEISFHPISKDNQTVGTACHSRNITEFVLLRDALTDTVRELADYKYALDESSIVAITNQKGTITYVNDNFCRISKYSREELIGQDHRIINSRYHSGEVIKDLWKTIGTGNVWRGELKNKTKYGGHYWVDTTIVPFLDSQGKPYQYIAIRSDITQKKFAEQQLRSSEEFSRGVLNSLSAHIAVIDSIGNIVTVNDAWEQYAMKNGYKWQKNQDEEYNYFDVCERSFRQGDNLAMDVLIGIKNVMARQIRDYYLEYPSHSPDAEQWFAMLAREFHGEEPMIVIAHQDITTRKLAEEKLIRQNEELQRTNFELDRFVYSVSHDLRSPLTAVLGLVSFIEDETSEEDTLTHIRMIRARINNLDDFIKNILNYSRNSRMEPQIERINIQELIQSVIITLSGTREAGGIKFKIETDPATVMFSDKQSILTLLENLVSNAIKFSSAKNAESLIRIKAKTEGHTIFISITDNGIGIPSEHQDRIFEMFYRISGDISGSGLGLYIVKSIVDKLGGTITVDSKVGSGTTFTVELMNKET